MTATKATHSASQFDAAKRQADGLSQLVRGSGDYPLLGRGDINLYSLFVERSMALVKPDGFRGTAHAVRHLRRQDRGGLLPFSLHRRARFEPVRLREQGVSVQACPRSFPTSILGSSSARSSSAARSAPSRRPTAPSSCTTRQTVGPTPTAASRWPRRTSRASTPTPAPRPSSAHAATPTSPAAFTNATRCW